MTYAVIGIFVLGLIIYDIWVVIAKGADQTISWKLYTASMKYPVIPFAIGFVMGHLFWVQHGG